ncbi:MAG: lipopolysaccharide heptosyltransferase II, partial [Deltaproteobacteria bacterium]|nr:lipopolysaccharide heptosyltransferase II [Deltaproteobacteria bacterium]
VAAIRQTFPKAHLAVLAKPWVAGIYEIGPPVDEIILFQSPGIHAGVSGKLRLATELRKRGFDASILLQNAIEAAIIVSMAGIPIRAGFDSDARGMLLTHAVRRTRAVRRIHQTGYYLEMVRALGCRSGSWDFPIRLDDSYDEKADKMLAALDVARDRRLLGIAPGATYGPAKKWFPERFAAVADRLEDEFDVKTLLFGSAGDRDSTAAVARAGRHAFIDLCGYTTLKEAVALMARCSLFISNDSGLMHVAGALGIPTIAIFGSTNPVTTSPVGANSVVIRKDVDCSPCLKKECPTDFRCMDLIGVEEVCEVSAGLLGRNGDPPGARP